RRDHGSQEKEGTTKNTKSHERETRAGLLLTLVRCLFPCDFVFFVVPRLLYSKTWIGGSGDWRGVAFGEAALVPVGIGGGDGAGGVEAGDLLGRQVPPDRPEVLPQLLLVAGADDDRRDAGLLEQPVECDLRDRLAG